MKKRQKICTVCGAFHSKKSPTCSRTCGYKIRKRVYTEEDKKNLSNKIKEWKKTDQGQLTNINLKNFKEDDEALLLPPIDYDSNYYHEDGDLWSPV